jgi:hypothetical protein
MPYSAYNNKKAGGMDRKQGISTAFGASAARKIFDTATFNVPVPPGATPQQQKDFDRFASLDLSGMG